MNNAAPYTQMIPVKENHKAKRKEMSAIQSFFVLCITEKIKKSKVLFYQKKAVKLTALYYQQKGLIQ
jgi:hypothetical protein